jgi:putative effector of murein hydrolase
MEYGKEEAMFSSLAMIFAALITLIWGALLVPLLNYHIF